MTVKLFPAFSSSSYAMHMALKIHQNDCTILGVDYVKSRHNFFLQQVSQPLLRPQSIIIKIIHASDQLKAIGAFSKPVFHSFF